jgi:hypothetical protein
VKSYLPFRYSSMVSGPKTATSPAEASSTQPTWPAVPVRERVDALGGRFEASPRAGGGFRVRAELPLPVPS